MGVTNEERDRETARRILESRVPFPEDAVVNGVVEALSTVRREGEAEHERILQLTTDAFIAMEDHYKAAAAVLREALKLTRELDTFHKPFCPLAINSIQPIDKCSCRRFEILTKISDALESTTAGTSLLKRLEDAERKARALDTLARMGTINIELYLDDSVSVGEQCDDDDRHPSLLEAIEAVTKEPK